MSNSHFMKFRSCMIHAMNQVEDEILPYLKECHRYVDGKDIDYLFIDSLSDKTFPTELNLAIGSTIYINHDCSKVDVIIMNEDQSDGVLIKTWENINCTDSIGVYYSNKSDEIWGNITMLTLIHIDNMKNIRNLDIRLLITEELTYNKFKVLGSNQLCTLTF